MNENIEKLLLSLGIRQSELEQGARDAARRKDYLVAHELKMKAHGVGMAIGIVRKWVDSIG